MARDKSENTVSRRRVLSNIGVGAAGLIGTSALSTAGAAQNTEVDLDEFQSRVSERYGEREGEIITNIVSEWASKKKQRNLSGEEVSNRIVAEVTEDPNTPNATDDIRGYREDVQQLQDQTVSSPTVEEVNDGSVSIAATGINPKYSSKKTNGTLNTRVDAFVNESKNELNAVSNSSVAGSGYAWCRLYGRFRPSKTRTYTVSSRYYRQGNSSSATAKIFFYIRPDGSGPIRKQVERMRGRRNSAITKATRFSMRRGRGYNVGVELYTRSDGTWKPISLADFYNGGNRVDVRNLRVA